MNTRQYSDRKASKRMTRSPLYQAVRQRAVTAEQTIIDLRRQVDALSKDKAAHEKQIGRLIQERDGAAEALRVFTEAAA